MGSNRKRAKFILFMVPLDERAIEQCIASSDARKDEGDVLTVSVNPDGGLKLRCYTNKIRFQSPGI
ncbi:hypothetical protein RISK_002995 [Rhodopirellula islandica]|uniref:Uncharacterized protein n=1 Tax=Rhodopirellula islandica TaxID=595434 RepID=A0A0J1BEJ0_RHOIS|nr:hypothetical protein [Rhodopirellula islandica]KLU05002.1 hypothetical protein RISK_002995 [Rhodopirellula islandica]